MSIVPNGRPSQLPLSTCFLIRPLHSTCRTTSLPNYVTVASRTTDIWPFECREISTFGKVWKFSW